MKTLAARLTPREQEVFSRLTRGLSNKAIGREMNLTEGTVKTYAHQIYIKLGVRTRYELAHLAFANSILPARHAPAKQGEKDDHFHGGGA